MARRSRWLLALFVLLLPIFADTHSPAAAQEDTIAGTPQTEVVPSPTATIEETSTETASATPTNDPSVATPTGTDTATATPIETGTVIPSETATFPATAIPVETVTPSPTEGYVPASWTDALFIFMDCTTSPEVTWVRNTSNSPIHIESIGSLLGTSSPIDVDIELDRWSTIELYSGPNADMQPVDGSHIFLTTSEFYLDLAYNLDGATVVSNRGESQGYCQYPSDAPGSTPTPSPLTFLSITLGCNKNPETTLIQNTSNVDIYLHEIQSFGASTQQVAQVSRILRAGESVTFLTGPYAAAAPQSSNVVFASSATFYPNTLYEKVRLRLSAGSGTYYAACPAKGKPPVPNTGPSFNVRITLNCRSNPETTRVDNLGTKPVFISEIYSIGSPGRSFELATARKVNSGSTVIFRSGSGAAAASGNAADKRSRFMYTDDAYDIDGTRIWLSDGSYSTVIEQRCPKRTIPVTPTPTPTPSKTPTPPPTPTAAPIPPTLLSISLNCYGSPETVIIKNVGQGNATLTSIGSLYQPITGEPFSITRNLAPGKSITYQAGSGATTNKLTGNFIFNNNVGSIEGVRIKVSTGKTFTKTC